MPRAATQLRLIGEIVDAFRSERIDVWLRGGWALDFLLGEVRSDHADVDLVTWRRNRDAVHRALVARGFALDRELENVGIDFVKDGESVQFMLVEQSDDGSPICHGFERWPLPENALDDELRVLAGVSCRTLAPHALLHEKTVYAARTRRPLRDKDRVSLELLERIVSPREPR